MKFSENKRNGIPKNYERNNEFELDCISDSYRKNGTESGLGLSPCNERLAIFLFTDFLQNVSYCAIQVCSNDGVCTMSDLKHDNN